MLASGPLAGRWVLLLRPSHQASPMAAAIEALGGEVVQWAAITIADPETWAPIDEAIDHLERYRWLVITSLNGVERFMGRLGARGRGPHDRAGLRVVAVGKATAQALEGLGVRVDLIPPEFRGKALPGVMAPLVEPGDRVLMPRGDLADPGLATALTALGARVDDLVAYRTVAANDEPTELKGLLAQGTIDYIAFTSSSTVTSLLNRIGGPAALGQARIACIGPDTAETARRLGLTVHLIAEPYTGEGLVEAIATDAARGGRRTS